MFCVRTSDGFYGDETTATTMGPLGFSVCTSTNGTSGIANATNIEMHSDARITFGVKREQEHIVKAIFHLNIYMCKSNCIMLIY